MAEKFPEKSNEAPKKPKASEETKEREKPFYRKNVEEPKDKKADEVVQSFILMLRFSDSKDSLFKSEKSDDKNFDKIIETIKGDKYRSEIKQRIEAGYKFKNFAESGLKMCWTKNGKEFIEINPIFEEKEFFNLLKEELKSKIKQQEITENTEKSFNSIVQYLKNKKFINKKLHVDFIKKSDFGVEVYDVLRQSYESKFAGKGEIYSIKSAKFGFILEFTEPFKKQGYEDLQYNMEKDFDENLKRIFKNPEKLKPKEREKYETEEEKEKEESKQNLSKMIAGEEVRMDKIASEYLEISSINGEVKDFMKDIQRLIEEKINEGKNPKEIRRIVSDYGDESLLGKKIAELEDNIKDTKLKNAFKEYMRIAKAVAAYTGQMYGIDLD